MLSVVILALAILGILQRVDSVGSYRLWNLDAEQAVPTYVSATILYAAAGLAVLTMVRAQLDRWVLLVAGLWVFLGVDEANAIHERLERATGIDWQVLYAPLAMAALLLFMALLRTTNGTSKQVLAAGAVGWAISQVLELVQNLGGEPVALYDWYMVPEEILELAGSALFVLGMLVVLRREPEPAT